MNDKVFEIKNMMTQINPDNTQPYKGYEKWASEIETYIKGIFIEKKYIRQNNLFNNDNLIPENISFNKYNTNKYNTNKYNTNKYNTNKYNTNNDFIFKKELFDIKKKNKWIE
jgi:hypothetical protein